MFEGSVCIRQGVEDLFFIFLTAILHMSQTGGLCGWEVWGDKSVGVKVRQTQIDGCN